MKILTDFFGIFGKIDKVLNDDLIFIPIPISITKWKEISMGALFFFDEVVTSNDNKGNKSKCQVEAVDNHGIPELRIGDEGEAYNGRIAEFSDWKQFERFVEAVNSLYSRLKGMN